MRMQTAPTPLDHMYAIVSLDILEMDKIAEVNFDRFFLIIEKPRLCSFPLKHAGNG